MTIDRATVVAKPYEQKSAAPQWMPFKVMKFVNLFRKFLGISPLTFPFNKYKMEKARELETVHAIDIENELVKAIGNEIERTKG